MKEELIHEFEALVDGSIAISHGKCTRFGC